MAFCAKHGHQNCAREKCPICGEPLEIYQRVTGYIRKVRFFNKGKMSEFNERNQLRGVDL